MAARTWKCQRVIKGEKCGHINPRVKATCQKCGAKSRPPATKPKHRWTLDVFPYKTWVAFYGETCNICGAPPKPGKKLQRDHDHRTGRMRGLLCWNCNSRLPYNADLPFMRKAVEYLEAAEPADS